MFLYLVTQPVSTTLKPDSNIIVQAQPKSLLQNYKKKRK